MDPFEFFFASMGIGRSRHMSAAGRLLDSLDKAEARITEESDITDELRCALLRADYKSQREPA